MDIAKIRKKIKDSETEPEITKEQEIPQETEEKTEEQTEKGEITLDSENKEKEESIEISDEEKTVEEHEIAEEQKFTKEQDIEIKEEVAKTTEQESKEKKLEIVSKTKPEESEEILEILSFRLLKEEFAFKISQIREILKYQRITKVPKTDKYVLGITSVRGKIVPVIDLKIKLSLTDEPQEKPKKSKILILKGPKGNIGVLVDDIVGVIRVAKKDLQPPPTHLTEKEMKYIEGVAVMDKRFISIINMEETIPKNLK